MPSHQERLHAAHPRCTTGDAPHQWNVEWEPPGWLIEDAQGDRLHVCRACGAERYLPPEPDWYAPAGRDAS